MWVKVSKQGRRLLFRFSSRAPRIRSKRLALHNLWHTEKDTQCRLISAKYHKKSTTTRLFSEFFLFEASLGDQQSTWVRRKRNETFMLVLFMCNKNLFLFFTRIKTVLSSFLTHSLCLFLRPFAYGARQQDGKGEREKKTCCVSQPCVKQELMSLLRGVHRKVNCIFSRVGAAFRWLRVTVNNARKICSTHRHSVGHPSFLWFHVSRIFFHLLKATNWNTFHWIRKPTEQVMRSFFSLQWFMANVANWSDCDAGPPVVALISRSTITYFKLGHFLYEKEVNELKCLRWG